jgi:hypothetical protein
MSCVIANLSMSPDGFTAYRADSVGHVLDW